jgi:hypothetical protein
MYGNETINDYEYAPGFYFCRYATELAALETIVNADNEEMAYRMGLEQLKNELGVEVTPMYWECQLEAH